MEAVRHGQTFIVKDSEIEKTFEMTILDRGFGYSTVTLREVVKYKRPRYYFFGDEVESTKKITLVDGHRENKMLPTIDRKSYYTKEYIRVILKQILKELKYDGVEIVKKLTI